VFLQIIINEEIDKDVNIEKIDNKIDIIFKILRGKLKIIGIIETYIFNNSWIIFIFIIEIFNDSWIFFNEFINDYIIIIEKFFDINEIIMIIDINLIDNQIYIKFIIDKFRSN
jgi:hypothetical protein